LVETGLRDRSARRAERAFLAGVLLPDRPVIYEAPLGELGRLVETAGAAVVGQALQRRQRPDASTFLGRGKVLEIAEAARSVQADVVVTEMDLSPAQVRNLEKLLGMRVVDRTELILDIFALHARTHQARLQVELAQMQYLMPRLRRMWTHLSREVGSGQSIGIGTRGPGEKQIEIDRRILRRKVTELRRELDEIAARRQRMAATRDRYFTISLVGYTNAGKSTLLHRLTGSETYIADQLFATLDTKTRAWELPDGKQVFLSDTVGFIRNLPHNLVASFYATLEEVRTADLILHVVDSSHPDAVGQIEAVQEVLAEIEAEKTPSLLVLNKCDRVEDPLDLRLLAHGRDPSVVVSASRGDGIGELCRQVQEFIAHSQSEAELVVPAGDGRVLAFLAERGTVLERHYEDGVVRVRVRLGPADHARVNRMLQPQAESP